MLNKFNENKGALNLTWRMLKLTPSIAQLVERRTVEAKLASLGRWFESGSKEILFIVLNVI